MRRAVASQIRRTFRGHIYAILKALGGRKPLQEIGRKYPDAVSLRASHNFTGADFLVISGRLAVVTADARDKDRVLKHVLCWMFDPPNENVVETIREWCEGIDNGADVIRELPDGESGIEDEP